MTTNKHKKKIVEIKKGSLMEDDLLHYIFFNLCEIQSQSKRTTFHEFHCSLHQWLFFGVLVNKVISRKLNIVEQ